MQTDEKKDVKQEELWRSKEGRYLECLQMAFGTELMSNRVLEFDRYYKQAVIYSDSLVKTRIALGYAIGLLNKEYCQKRKNLSEEELKQMDQFLKRAETVVSVGEIDRIVEEYTEYRKAALETLEEG